MFDSVNMLSPVAAFPRIPPCVHVCICDSVNECAYVCMCMCVCAWIHICMRMYISEFTYKDMYTYLCMFAHIFMRTLQAPVYVYVQADASIRNEELHTE